MHVLLPPSETKAVGGDRPALDLPSLSFPQLNSARELMIRALADLSSDLPLARKALGVTSSKDPEIAGNTIVSTAPAMPALHRYTGVLYDALDARTFTGVQAARASTRLVITSALFGLLRPDDRIPAYRLSAGSKLPALLPIPQCWRTRLLPALRDLSGPVVDLRSGAYAAFAPLPEAISVRVVTVGPDGDRTVVSHFNKATKGALARVLATTRAEVTDVASLLRVLRRAGMTVERSGENSLEVLT